MTDSPSRLQHPVAPRNFITTNWSLIRQATSGDDTIVRAALETLCSAYWYPIYAYVRSRNRSEQDAEDITQGFFAQMLRRNDLAKADSVRGKLRSFLLASVKHYLISEYEAASAKKRGGDKVIVSFDLQWAESTFTSEPVDELTPDKIYQRRWALTVLEFSFDLLREEYASDGKEEQYNRLRPMLGFTTERESDYVELSARTGVPVNTLKVQAHRLRGRWKEIFREQIALTLEEPTDQNIKEELWELLDSV